MADEIAPSASRVARRAPASAPGMPSKNHHGTPFIAGSTSVSSPRSGAMPAATAGNDGALTAITTPS